MDWTVFIVFFGACCTAAATGSMFPPGAWYESLRKPPWNPPNWLFPVAWTVLYIVIAIAAARIAVLQDNAMAIGFWTLQITLNTLWTPVFFGLRRIKAGMVIIGMLWIAVFGAIFYAFQLDPVAGWLLVPYLVWVTVAASLNGAVWYLNPAEANAPKSQTG